MGIDSPLPLERSQRSRLRRQTPGKLLVIYFCYFMPPVIEEGLFSGRNISVVICGSIRICENQPEISPDTATFTNLWIFQQKFLPQNKPTVSRTLHTSEWSHSYWYEQSIRLCNNRYLPPVECFSQLCHRYSHVRVDRHGTKEVPEPLSVVQSEWSRSISHLCQIRDM